MEDEAGAEMKTGRTIRDREKIRSRVSRQGVSPGGKV